MRTMLLLSIYWGGSLVTALAQVRPAGPWHLVAHQQRVSSWLADTTTTVQLRRDPVPVAWNVNPATITLLRNCENPLLAPPPGAAIRLSLVGATLRLDRATQRLLVMPTGPVVVLRAYRGRHLAFTHTFRVRAAPLPTVMYFYGESKEINLGGSAKPSESRCLQLKLVPNMEFAAVMPADAYYRIARFRATLLRREQPVVTRVVDGAQANLSAWYSISQPGDLLRVDILRAERRNFKEAVSLVPLPKRFTLPYRERLLTVTDTTSQR